LLIADNPLKTRFNKKYFFLHCVYNKRCHSYALPFFTLFLFCVFSFCPKLRTKKCAADTARANELFTLGEKFGKASKLDSAALCYEQAAEIWEKACPEVKGEKRKRFWEGYLKSKNSRGLVFSREGKLDSAAAYYLQSALQKALPWLGENHLDVADNHNNTGVIYFGVYDNIAKCLNLPNLNHYLKCKSSPPKNL
jgi:tetratricopeptide (TPR) repeat protein